jgi:hypothetical protein
MVMRVHRHRASRSFGNKPPRLPQGEVLEINGRSELAINMSISGTNRYTDWVCLGDDEGEVYIQGNHVHDLISSILRFSEPYMRKLYRELLDMTDVVTGHASKDQYKFDNSQIESAKRRRKDLEKFNAERKRKLNSIINSMK